MHHPLQQGLRPSQLSASQVLLHVQVHHPLQQGLRLSIICPSFNLYQVQVHHPLQQGLRLHIRIWLWHSVGQYKCIIHYSKDEENIPLGLVW